MCHRALTAECGETIYTCRAPPLGELEMTPSTSEVAVCCSSASLSFFSRSRARALSFFTSAAWDSCEEATRALGSVLVERRPRTRIRLFASLRDKVTSSAQSLVPFRGPSQGSSLSILTEPRYETRPAHSITSSARASNLSGMVSPSVFAVARLITSSNLVGCSTGRSAGFAPSRIRLT
jgi:hypothetical protein